MKTYKPSNGASTMVECPEGEYILKKDIQPTLDAFNKIKKELLSEKDNLINFIISTIKNQIDYQELQSIPFEEIALHINEYDKGSYEFFFLSCRLSNEDPFEKNIGSCMYLLFNQSFDTEDYQRIGVNDGKIEVVSYLLSLIGLEKEAEEVSQAKYNP